MTKPFPAEMLGKFDLIHMSLLVYALTEQGWKKALDNCRDLLKPGGLLFMTESDAIFFTDEAPAPDADASGHDFEANMSGPTWRHKANSVYTGGSLRNKFIPDLSFRLPSMLESSSFTVLSKKRGKGTFGKLCTIYKGLDGSSLDDEAELSLANFDQVIDILVGIYFKNGTLEAPKGVKISSAEESKQLVEEIKCGVREAGAYIVIADILARKH
ncbi:hypothetical protein EVG20_g8287 [Dentipellis fragilis]|uniref:Methyltransferase type 11 domain-containing protein n=1 Tax=Dentipellis fragilis TaxID=205917 RepID=A0A4Y9Y7Q1_9AGAM|nr:hypothetical protein EVG20_g8287 [Dentipellis fragilis]